MSQTMLLVVFCVLTVIIIAALGCVAMLAQYWLAKHDAASRDGRTAKPTH